MSAAPKVFADALLVERIVLHITSPAEVSRARGINTFVKATINNSRALRRILSLDTEPASTSAKGDDTMKAVARVFGITELLEQVLENLAAAEITRARQVNSYFKQTIDKSLPLRRAMFLEPEPEHETLFYEPEDLATPEASDDGWDADTDTDTDTDSAEPTTQPAKSFTVTRFHPAIRPSSEVDDEFVGFFDFKLPDEKWAPGMWQDMLICQPPSEKFKLMLLVWRREMFQHVAVHRPVAVQRPMEGNTLGALVAAVEGLESGVMWTKLGTVDCDVEQEGSDAVLRARDRMLASKLADREAAMCEGENDEMDEDVSKEVEEDAASALDEELEEDSDEETKALSKIKQNRFGKPSMI